MWISKATAGLPNIPLLGPEAAGIPQQQGISTGLLSQNGDPPYAAPNLEVLVHWLKDSPLRPSNIRAPGKVANSFAVECITDELASLAGMDPVAFRVEGISDPRGLEVIRRTAALMDWQPRNGPARKTTSTTRPTSAWVWRLSHPHHAGVPRIVIELIDRPADPPLGAGEAAAAPVAAALANAVFDATGARLRTVPFTSARVKAALERGQA
jgi:CO/xanthine dehydrogenase Mo-binding subunit